MIEYFEEPKVKLIEQVGNEMMVIKAARMSFDDIASENYQEPVDIARFVRRMSKEGHILPIEQGGELWFHIVCDISTSRQILKYRHTSINEKSQRYSTLKGQAYMPSKDRPVYQTGKRMDYVFKPSKLRNRLARAIIRFNTARAFSMYKLMIFFGISNEVARYALPMNTSTSMLVKGNLVHWFHFIHQRMTAAPSHGQAEIAMVADQVAAVLQKLYPNVYAQFVANGYILKGK